MPVYSYTALSENGRVAEGEEAAASADELSRTLVQRGLRVQRVQERRARLPLFGRKTVRPEAFLLFNQEFSALIRAGLTIPEALQLAAERKDNRALSAVLQRVLEDVRQGKMLSEACAQHPEVFDGLYLSTVKTGEKAGNLVAVLQKYQESLKTRVAFDKKLSHALAYPLFLLVTLGIVLAVLFVFVMPRFVAMYTDFGAELPFATRALVHFVNHILIYVPLAVIAGGIGWTSWRRWVQTDEGRLRADLMKRRLPVIGAIGREVGIAQLARTLATLLSGGTPLVEAMRTTQESLRNRADALQLTGATRLVTEGKSLAAAMQETALMPDTAIKMIQVGEASGSLDTMLGEIAQYYEEQLANRLARASALVEPALMLLMGLLIGGIIVVMYLPIFYMADIVK